MANAWMDHVKNTMKLNKGLKFKEILKKAKKTYKKVTNSILSNNEALSDHGGAIYSDDSNIMNINSSNLNCLGPSSRYIYSEAIFINITYRITNIT